MTKSKTFLQAIPVVLLMGSLLISTTGLASTTPNANNADLTGHAQPSQSTDIVEGKILGKSKKAQILTIKNGDNVELVQFDDQSKGLEFAYKGETVIIEYTQTGKAKIARLITPKPAELPSGVQQIDIDDMADLLEQPADSYLIIDARSARKYNMGHIPSAVSLPLPALQAQTSRLKDLNIKDKTIIFYSDSPTCALCTEAARIAATEGLANIKVMLAGIQGWEEEGNALAVSDALIENSHVILIDTRSKSEVSAGHVPNAINILPEDLSEETQYDFPPQKDAPIAFYGDAEKVQQAEKIFSDWGYWQLRSLDGGLAGWQQRGGQIKTGPAPGAEGIAWVELQNNQTISTQDFRELIANSTAEALIIDVRSTKEASRGKLKNSLNIPLEELAARLSEIPSDKPLITHCTTGARAEMAAAFLEQYRDDVRFLSAKVRCKGEKCRIR